MQRVSDQIPRAAANGSVVVHFADGAEATGSVLVVAWVDAADGGAAHLVKVAFRVTLTGLV